MCYSRFSHRGSRQYLKRKLTFTRVFLPPHLPHLWPFRLHITMQSHPQRDPYSCQEHSIATHCWLAQVLGNSSFTHKQVRKPLHFLRNLDPWTNDDQIVFSQFPIMSDLFGKSPSIHNDSLQAYTSAESLRSEVPRRKTMLCAMHLCIQITTLLEDRQKKQGKYFRAQDYAARSFKWKATAI